MEIFFMELYCDHCEKDTEHKVTGSGHERDSSYELFECQECKWWKLGMTDEYEPPWEDMRLSAEPPQVRKEARISSSLKKFLKKVL